MKTVLWLDDDLQLVDAGIPVFASYGFRIRKASSIEEASNILETEDIQGLLLDMYLADGEHGLDFLDLVREQYPSLRVAIFTGYPEYDEQFLAERLGAKYLIKINKSIPLEPDQQRRFFFVLHQIFARSQDLDLMTAKAIQAELADIQKTVETGFSDMRQGQSDLLAQINRENRQLTEAILERIQLGRIEQAEMASVVNATARLLQLLRAESELWNAQMLSTIEQANNAIEGELDLHNKLELTLPIIPFLLAYKIELDGIIGADVSAALGTFQRLLKNLAA